MPSHVNDVVRSIRTTLHLSEVHVQIFSLVELYQDGDIVAEGRVVELQPCSVHNHPITSNEVKVEVSKLHKPTIHPTHGYDIEEGAFTAWNLKNIAVIS